MMIVPGVCFIPHIVATSIFTYDAYLSGQLDNTWHDFSVCRQYGAFTIPYGQFDLVPQSGSTWSAGFRPATVTVSGVDIATYLAGGVINIYDTDNVLIGSGDPEVSIALTFGSADIGHLEIYGDWTQPLEICSITWA